MAERAWDAWLAGAVVRGRTPAGLERAKVFKEPDLDNDASDQDSRERRIRHMIPVRKRRYIGRIVGFP